MSTAPRGQFFSWRAVRPGGNDLGRYFSARFRRLPQVMLGGIHGASSGSGAELPVEIGEFGVSAEAGDVQDGEV